MTDQELKELLNEAKKMGYLVIKVYIEKDENGNFRVSNEETEQSVHTDYLILDPENFNL